MRNRISPPALAVLLGIAAALLRLWQKSTGLGGLPAAGHPSTFLLLILCAAAAFCFLAIALRAKAACPTPSPAAPGAAQRVFLLLSALTAALSLFFYLRQVIFSVAARFGLAPVLLEAVLSLAAILALFSLLYLALNGAPSPTGESYARLFPPLYAWLWLIDVYRKHTANPVLWDHAFLLLAAVALLLASFWRAGVLFGQPRPFPTAFAALCGLFLVPIALMGDHDTPSLCIALSLSLYSLTALLWPPVPPSVSTEEDEEDPQPLPDTCPAPQETEIETEEPSDE